MNQAFCTFLQLLCTIDYDVKIPHFTFCGGRKHKTTTFFLFSWTSIRNSLLELNSRKNCQKVVELIVWNVICPRSHFSSNVKAWFRRRTFHEPNLIHWILKVHEKFGVWINLERLSRSFRLAWPGISPLERLRRVWFRHRTFHVPNLVHKLL